MTNHTEIMRQIKARRSPQLGKTMSLLQLLSSVEQEDPTALESVLVLIQTRKAEFAYDRAMKVVDILPLLG